MATSDFTTTIAVDRTLEETFQAINNVQAWWTEDMEGSSQKQNDEFTVRFGDIHTSKQKLIELVPNKKVVWLVTDSQLNFLKDKEEWTDTKISFELSNEDEKTKVHFTHFGLTPQVECYQSCTRGWDYFINGSLYQLLTAGKGTPGIPSIAQ